MIELRGQLAALHGLRRPGRQVDAAADGFIGEEVAAVGIGGFFEFQAV